MAETRKENIMRMLKLISTEIDGETTIRTFRVATQTALAFCDYGGYTDMVDEQHISVATGNFEDASEWEHVLHDEMIDVGVNPDEYGI